jgi:hypothetical protein
MKFHRPEDGPVPVYDAERGDRGPVAVPKEIAKYKINLAGVFGRFFYLAFEGTRDAFRAGLDWKGGRVARFVMGTDSRERVPLEVSTLERNRRVTAALRGHTLDRIEIEGDHIELHCGPAMVMLSPRGIVVGTSEGADRLCVKCGAVLIAACECPHCGTALQDQGAKPRPS